MIKRKRNLGLTAFDEKRDGQQSSLIIGPDKHKLKLSVVENESDPGDEQMMITALPDEQNENPEKDKLFQSQDGSVDQNLLMSEHS